ncbi:MAG TPA: DUF1028 domain-containing protein [Gammaproteobacteria bacterium]
MTFSVVARCARTGKFGVAAATATNAVGKLVSHAMAKYGAIATQAMLNPYLGYDGLRLLQRGSSAREALKRLLANDPHPGLRQVGIVDGEGSSAAWTGNENLHWAGHREEHNFSVQGNRMAGPGVLDAAVETMHATEDKDLAERLLLALEAGDAKGGDRLGERSGNILVFDHEEYPQWDIRVDDHDKPIEELRRLFHLFQDELLSHMNRLPTRKDYPQIVNDEDLRLPVSTSSPASGQRRRDREE